MEKHEFLKLLSQQVHAYIDLAEEMCNVLTELKKSLLAFDNRKLNQLLDEKLVMNEQILLVNQQVDDMMCVRYGEFSKQSSEKLIDEFPMFKLIWRRLQDLMCLLKVELLDVKRVLSMIEKYNTELLNEVEQTRSQYYNHQAHLTSKEV